MHGILFNPPHIYIRAHARATLTKCDKINVSGVRHGHHKELSMPLGRVSQKNMHVVFVVHRPS